MSAAKQAPVTASTAARVGVIDIGSNSIKTLVAAEANSLVAIAPPRSGAVATPVVESLFSRSIEARISAGADWQAGRSRLASEAIKMALVAIHSLLADCAVYAPIEIALVGTSALRDAANAHDFAARVRDETGHALRILSGDEEAAAIGRGLLCDPLLGDVSHAYAFDLGGGSLECLALREGVVTAAQSLPLGSVRLMRSFVQNPEGPLAVKEREAIRAHVTAAFAEAEFTFDALAGNAAAPPRLIGTGGLWFNVRQMLAAIERQGAELAPPFLPRAQIERVLEIAAALPLAERRRLPGISPGRADILPTALTTMLTVLDLVPRLSVSGLQHSAYNLRYGIAAELLGRQAA